MMLGPMITVNSRTMSSTSSNAFANSSRHKSVPKNLRHVLSISASVTRLYWRPPANDTATTPFSGDDDEDEDRHDSMLAVATAPIKGASAGGSGMLALWSFHRPYMPLSVVEGHKDGAVTDFAWLDTPLPPSPMRRRRGDHETRLRGSHQHETDAILYDNNASMEHEDNNDDDHPLGIWQHVLSVGRDGRCLIQSFARGGLHVLKTLILFDSRAELVLQTSYFPFKAIARFHEYLRPASPWQTSPPFKRDMDHCSSFQYVRLYHQVPIAIFCSLGCVETALQPLHLACFGKCR